MTILIFSLSFSFLIFIIKDTDAIIEYYNLFKLKGLKWFDDYNKRNQHGYIESLNSYITREKGNLFLVKLVTCPYCISTWLGIFTIPWTHFSFLVVSYLTLLLYFFLVQIKKQL
jgi:hypothetical protein